MSYIISRGDYTNEILNIKKNIYETRIINEIVKRNIKRFPEDFYFQLTSIFKKLATVEYKLLEYDELMNCLSNEVFEQKVFFDGQIYDAYSLILDIFNTATNKIVVIDNYIDKTIILKYEQKYKSIDIIYSDKFDDRFIIIDKVK